MRQPCVSRWAALCLPLLMHGFTGTGSAADAVLPAKALGVGEFLALDIAEYKIEQMPLEAAVEKLRELATQQTGAEMPMVDVVRYPKDIATESNPWKMQELVTLEVRQESVTRILEVLGELTGFVVNADKGRLGLYQVPRNPAKAATTVSKAKDAGPLSIEEFVALKIPHFQCANESPAAAIAQLRHAAEKLTGRKAPPVGLVHFQKFELNSIPPAKAAESNPVIISFDLKEDTAGNIIRYIAELGSCITRYHASCIGLHEALGFYHPKVVRQYSLKEIIAVWGKPEKPIADWLEKTLRAHDIQVGDVIGVNERTGQVFITCPPEFAGAILRKR